MNSADRPLKRLHPFTRVLSAPRPNSTPTATPERASVYTYVKVLNKNIVSVCLFLINNQSGQFLSF